MTGVSTQPPAHRRQLIALVLTACCVEAISWFVVTAGRIGHLPGYYLTFLDGLAEGFRQGHLHMNIEPPTELLRQANPFASENSRFWYWDASLYGRHYYLYWGPVPALLLAIAKTLLRTHAVVYDEVVVFALSSLQLAAGTWMIGRAARTFFRRAPLALQVLAVVVMGFANPIPYNLGRGAVYEAAIVGGQAFLLLGLACAAESVARTERRTGWRVAAGVAWALALGCRVSLAPAVALIILATAWLEAGPAETARARLRRLVAAGLPLAIPVAIGLFLLLLYNRLRFEAWFEFGRQYQLSWILSPTSLRYLPFGLYSFLLRQPALSCRFPFFFAIPDMGARAFPSWVHLPKGYFVYEQVAGLLLACPWSWLSLAALADAVRRLRRDRALSPPAWAVVTAALAAVMSLLPAMTVASATNRYLGDAVGGIVLLGAFGAFVLADVRRTAARRAGMVAVVVLAVASAWAGLALGFYGQYAHFPNNNPRLADKLVRSLSLCGPTLPPVPK